MSGLLYVIGLGPGPEHWVTPEATQALAAVSDIYGYAPYVQRVALRSDCRLHASDNRVELSRAGAALEAAAQGRCVGIVSGGDPGVFAMAAAVIEAIELGPPAWREIDLDILPGVSAMFAAAARLGAPLGADFCAISLSDNLKPWTLIERRLIAACEGDFVLAIYNPASRARPRQIHDAFDILRARRAAGTPVAFARAVGRADESLHLTNLGEADPARADMATLVIVGASNTRLVPRPGRRPYVLTPRSVERSK